MEQERQKTITKVPYKRPKPMDLIAATTIVDAAFIDIQDAVGDDEEAWDYFQFIREAVVNYLQSELLLAMIEGGSDDSAGL